MWQVNGFISLSNTQIADFSNMLIFYNTQYILFYSKKNLHIKIKIMAPKVLLINSRSGENFNPSQSILCKIKFLHNISLAKQ